MNIVYSTQACVCTFAYFNLTARVFLSSHTFSSGQTSACWGCHRVKKNKKTCEYWSGFTFISHNLILRPCFTTHKHTFPGTCQLKWILLDFYDRVSFTYVVVGQGGGKTNKKQIKQHLFLTFVHECIKCIWHFFFVLSSEKQVKLKKGRDFLK